MEIFMFGKRVLTLAALTGALLGGVPAWGAVVEAEVVFAQVSRVAKKYNNCTNDGNTYTLEITGQADGVEKIISLPNVEPNKPDDDDASRAEADMAAFCEKAALLTKSLPEKHDLYIQIKYENQGGGGPSNEGLCTSTGSSTRVRGTQLVCELR